MPKKRVSMAWYQYQEQVRLLFASLGFEAESNVEATGVRGKHDVDVYVSVKQFGIGTTWVVECKCWKRNVPKEKVLALHSVIADVGADKGFLFSEKGFQSGAVAAARRTNIILTSIAEVQSEAAQELRLLRIRQCADAIDEALYAMRSLPCRTQRTVDKIAGRSVGCVQDYVPPNYFHYIGLLVAFEHELKDAKRGKEKGLLIGVDDKGQYRSTDSFDSFVEHIAAFLVDAKAYVAGHKEWKPEG